MSIPHFKDAKPAFAEHYFGIFYHCSHIKSYAKLAKGVEVFLKYKKYTESEVQIAYLIHLIKKKTPNPPKKIMDLINSDELTNIETAYLLTYPNEKS